MIAKGEIRKIVAMHDPRRGGLCVAASEVDSEDKDDIFNNCLEVVPIRENSYGLVLYRLMSGKYMLGVTRRVKRTNYDDRESPVLRALIFEQVEQMGEILDNYMKTEDVERIFFPEGLSESYLEPDAWNLSALVYGDSNGEKSLKVVGNAAGFRKIVRRLKETEEKVMLTVNLDEEFPVFFTFCQVAKNMPRGMFVLANAETFSRNLPDLIITSREGVYDNAGYASMSLEKLLKLSDNFYPKSVQTAVRNVPKTSNVSMKTERHIVIDKRRSSLAETLDVCKRYLIDMSVSDEELYAALGRLSLENPNEYAQCKREIREQLDKMEIPSIMKKREIECYMKLLYVAYKRAPYVDNEPGLTSSPYDIDSMDSFLARKSPRNYRRYQILMREIRLREEDGMASADRRVVKKAAKGSISPL